MNTVFEMNNGKTKIQNLNLGFVGLGWIGRKRMEQLLVNPQINCSAILEPVPAHAEKALSLAKGCKIVENFEELLEDNSIDGLVIATPSAMHARQTTEALRAGKAVFCQKPLGRDRAEVEQVIRASSEMDRLVSVDLSYKFTRAFTAVYETIKEGKIGKIYAADLIFHNAFGPDKDWFYDYESSGGGCVLDLGVHMLDLALWSLEFPFIDRIESHLYHSGEKMQKGEEKVEDYASVLLTTEADTVLNLQCSWHISAGRDAVIEARFYGTEGGVAFRNINGSFYDFTAERYTGTQTEVLVSPPDDWGGNAGMLWADAIMNGAGYDEVTAQEFLQLTEIIDRIYGR